MTRAAKIYSIDHPKIRTAGWAASIRRAPRCDPEMAIRLLRAERDRLPRWG